MREGIHVVGIGGGTGLSVLLAGLRACAQHHRREHREPVRVSAIVSVADDGGSTGMLRRHLGIPAVGDLRNCIVALAGGDPLWNDLFQFRFGGGEGLAGHALGNLIVAALVERSGGLGPAIEQLNGPLCLGGHVLPVSEEALTLCAELADGRVVLGESLIPTPGQRISRVWLEPRTARPAAGVLETLASADAIVLGPGSLFTSVVPNLLVAGVAETIRRSSAVKMYVCNLRTQHGETDGFDAVDHLRVIEEHLGPDAVDVCLVDVGPTPATTGAGVDGPAGRPVRWTRRDIAAMGVLPVAADLSSRAGRYDRHDPRRLGEIVVSLALGLHRWDAEPLAVEAAAPQARIGLAAVSGGAE